MAAVGPEVTSVIQGVAPPSGHRIEWLHLLGCHSGVDSALTASLRQPRGEGCVARVLGGKALGIASRCPREVAGHTQTQVRLYTWQAFHQPHRNTPQVLPGGVRGRPFSCERESRCH